MIIPRLVGTNVADFEDINAAYDVIEENIHGNNLLHNWDWRYNPVNQRAATGAISSGYIYDLWLRYAGAITINAGYLSFPAGAAADERIGGNSLSGKVATASVMLGDVVYSGTGTFPTSAGEVIITIAGFGTATLGYATGYMYVRFTAATSTRQVQAVKIELGAVSTLAYDPPMEYGLEMVKCNRYYRELGYGLLWTAESTTVVVSCQIFSPEMRIAPTLALLTAAPVIGDIPYTATFTGSGSTLTDYLGTVRGESYIKIDGFTGLTAGKQYLTLTGRLLSCSSGL